MTLPLSPVAEEFSSGDLIVANRRAPDTSNTMVREPIIEWRDEQAALETYPQSAQAAASLDITLGHRGQIVCTGVYRM